METTTEMVRCCVEQAKNVMGRTHEIREKLLGAEPPRVRTDEVPDRVFGGVHSDVATIREVLSQVESVLGDVAANL